jgi:hypothetical protein
MKRKIQKNRALHSLVLALFALPLGAQAQVIFSDNFNAGASPLWGNQSGNWAASGGVYNAQNPFAIDYTSLPFTLTDFAVDVDINDVADGGLWLRSDASGQNGILLVTGGNGWGFGSRSSLAGRSLYWHVIQNGSISPQLNEVDGLFTPEVSDIHLRIEVIGNVYAAYLNGSSTPVTSLTNSLFPNGEAGLYDFSSQTFDNFTLSQVPEPSSLALLLIGSFGFFMLKKRLRILA